MIVFATEREREKITKTSQEKKRVENYAMNYNVTPKSTSFSCEHHFKYMNRFLFASGIRETDLWPVMSSQWVYLMIKTKQTKKQLVPWVRPTLCKYCFSDTIVECLSSQASERGDQKAFSLVRFGVWFLRGCIINRMMHH